MYGNRYPSVETYTHGAGMHAYCYLEKKRPSAYSKTYSEQVRLGKIELEQLIERRIQRLGDSECSVVVSKDGKGNCSLLKVQPNENPVSGTSTQVVGDDMPLVIQQVVQSYRSAATLQSPTVPQIQPQATAAANVHLVQVKPKKPKLTAKERAEKAHLKDLLALQDKMGGPGAMFGLNVLLGGKPTRRDLVAARLQTQIAQVTNKVNAINSKAQTAQVVARPVIVGPPRTTVKQPVSFLF
jgi:hypothetical protein